MRVALFTDIHGNRQAFEVCLAQSRDHGAERIVLLGDYVGYGGDPEWCVDTVGELVGRGAIALRGNHDDAIGGSVAGMNPVAAAALLWTRERLDAGQRRFLAALPLTKEAHDCLFVHADASRPERWNYVTNALEAARSMAATDRAVTICGHVHEPALFSLADRNRLTAETPFAGVAITFTPGRKWLVVLGAVGQPRDGDPRACWAMLDTERRELTLHRVAYDIEAAADAIRRQGLPRQLADRLFVGQ